jgi:hemoglobin-like flavoprotein
MTAEQINSVRDSYAGLECRSELLALLFYKRLFELAPELQPLFRGDIETQARKFAQMLELSVLLVDCPALLVPHLESLGRRHALYGIKDGDYLVVGQALLWSLSEALGSELSVEAHAAWAVFYRFLASTMQNGTALGDAWHHVTDRPGSPLPAEPLPGLHARPQDRLCNPAAPQPAATPFLS